LYDPAGNYDKSQEILETLIELPVYCQLSIKEQNYIIKNINDFI